MRIVMTIITWLALFAAAGFATGEADKKSTLYTAYSIWRASNI